MQRGEERDKTGFNFEGGRLISRIVATVNEKLEVVLLTQMMQHGLLLGVAAGKADLRTLAPFLWQLACLGSKRMMMVRMLSCL